MKNTFSLNKSCADILGIGLFRYSLLPKEKFIATNSTLPKMLAYPKSEFQKKKFKGLFQNAKAKEEFFRILNKEGKIKFFEAVLKDKKNKNVWVAITATRLVNKNKSEYLEGIVENISSHKEMEEKLALEKDFLQGLLDNIPDAIYFKDRNNHIIKVNKFYARGVSMKPEDIIGKTDFDFFPPEQAEQMFKDDYYVLRTGKPIVGKVERTILKNGSWNQVITTKIPMHDRTGQIIGTMGITRDMTTYANLERERLAMLINALAVLGKALEMRDPYTFSHNRNVAEIVEKITRKLGWDENRILGVKLAAELHDIGKISIPLDILNKPGKLSDLEFQLVKEHVIKCYELIKDIEFPFSLAETIYQHHERLDGSGYPRGLKEKDIILEARILAVCDVLESMTSYRPYREPLGLDKALDELKKDSGSKYDQTIVEVASSLIEANEKKPFWLNN
ncbi:MAG: PAS domain S-box protein [Candidatus Omnitrophica bacterium]|nr:PAS domain S-box protein [Candidatus Omnitrophota bacterium]